MAKLKLDNAITSDLKTAASDSFIDNLKMLDIADIIPNENNFYELSDIEDLADDIERQGLMSVLVVAEDGGQYRLISGHRRLAAIKLLIEQGRRKSATVPCYIKGMKSPDETQLDLIMMNATQRKYTDKETLREYEELTRIFKAMEAAGEPVKGKIRDNIARVLNISPSQVGKIDYIKNNAIPDVEQAVKSGEMSISTAREVAALEPEQQREIIERKPDISHKEVKALQKSAKPKVSVAPREEICEDDADEDIAESVELPEADEEIALPESDEDAEILQRVEPLVLSEKESAVLAKYVKALLLAARDEDYETIKGITERLTTA